MTDENHNPGRALRWSVMGLAVLAVGLYIGSYFAPYWHFTLMAPQYPDGLTIDIFLTHLEGDVREINGLNHYIGMRSLDEAAQLERQFAGWAIGLLCVSVVAFTLLPGRKFSWLILLPAVLFPLGFMADSFYWLYTFGNNLDETAPINIAPFTPTLLGKGEVGQFATVAFPGVGFYLAIGALAVLIVTFVLRKRVCKGCARRGTCGKSCPHFLVTGPSDEADAPQQEPATGE